MVAAVAAATSIPHRTLGDVVLAKEQGFIPASVLQCSREEEEKEEVYGPGTSSGNDSGDDSKDKNEDVDHSAETTVPVDKVRVYVFI